MENAKNEKKENKIHSIPIGHTYLCIDLKSFYASVECQERHLDPLTTNLVVADPSRTSKTICLAVSPALKAYGISGRARLFEVESADQKGKSYASAACTRVIDLLATSCNSGPAFCPSRVLPLDYVTAPPRMSHYMEQEYSGLSKSI